MLYWVCSRSFCSGRTSSCDIVSKVLPAFFIDICNKWQNLLISHGADPKWLSRSRWKMLRGMHFKFRPYRSSICHRGVWAPLHDHSCHYKSCGSEIPHGRRELQVMKSHACHASNIPKLALSQKHKRNHCPMWPNQPTYGSKWQVLSWVLVGILRKLLVSFTLDQLVLGRMDAIHDIVDVTMYWHASTAFS